MMVAEGIKKAGWRWTKQGWKRRPRRTRKEKVTSSPSQPLPSEGVSLTPPPKEKRPTFKEARRIAAEKAKAAAARDAAAEVEKRASREPRKAWHGKYDQLNPKAGDSQDGEPSP
jgi:hypothetical protein